MRSRIQPIRLLTAVPICDGHDSAITTINLELVHHGIEVIYLGYHRSARDIARAAAQEDVRAIGISSYNGGHVEFFSDVADQLRALGARPKSEFLAEAEGRSRRPMKKSCDGTASIGSSFRERRWRTSFRL